MARDLSTQQQILKDARRMVRGEKVADFLNDPKQYYLLAARWVLNDEQRHIDEYYANK